MTHRERVKRFFSHEPIDRIPFVDWGGHPCFYMDKWKEDGSIAADADPFVLAGFDGSEGHGTEEIIDKDHHHGHFYHPTKGFEQVNYNIYAVPEFEVVKWADGNGYQYQVDTGSVVELLGYTGGLWISGDIFRELLLPRYKRMVSVMRAHGIRYIYMDSIGALKKFIPALIDIGFNGLYGVYMADGLDVVELKKEYGKDFFLMGGIDRRIVSNGTKKDIKAEIERVMAVLPIGGYLPHLDGSIFYGTPAENYFYCAELVGKSLGAI